MVFVTPAFHQGWCGLRMSSVTRCISDLAQIRTIKRGALTLYEHWPFVLLMRWPTEVMQHNSRVMFYQYYQCFWKLVKKARKSRHITKITIVTYYNYIYLREILDLICDIKMFNHGIIFCASNCLQIKFRSGLFQTIHSNNLLHLLNTFKFNIFGFWLSRLNTKWGWVSVKLPFPIE